MANANDPVSFRFTRSRLAPSGTQPSPVPPRTVEFRESDSANVNYKEPTRSYGISPTNQDRHARYTETTDCNQVTSRTILADESDTLYRVRSMEIQRPSPATGNYSPPDYFPSLAGPRRGSEHNTYQAGHRDRRAGGSIASASTRPTGSSCLRLDRGSGICVAGAAGRVPDDFIGGHVVEPHTRLVTCTTYYASIGLIVHGVLQLLSGEIPMSFPSLYVPGGQ